MKAIEKVAVTPVQVNNGTIIDSFNTSDDKHTNAPSLNAVETKMGAVETKMGTVQTATLTATKSNITFTLNFKRNMNIVTLNIKMEIPSTVTTASNWLTSTDFLMPEWAKTNDDGVVNLDTTIAESGMQANNDFIAFSAVGRVALSRANSNDYRLLYAYNQAQSVSYPDGNTLNLSLKYIVLD